MLFKALISQCNAVCLLHSVLCPVSSQMTYLCTFLKKMSSTNKEKSQNLVSKQLLLKCKGTFRLSRKGLIKRNLLAHQTGSVRSGWAVLASPRPHDCHVSRGCHEVTLDHVTSQLYLSRALVTGVMLTSERITGHWQHHQHNSSGGRAAPEPTTAALQHSSNSSRVLCVSHLQCWWCHHNTRDEQWRLLIGQGLPSLASDWLLPADQSANLIVVIVSPSINPQPRLWTWGHLQEVKWAIWMAMVLRRDAAMPNNDNIYTNYETLTQWSLFSWDKCRVRAVVSAIWQFMNIEALLMMIVWKILSGARVKIIMSKWHCQMILT